MRYKISFSFVFAAVFLTSVISFAEDKLDFAKPFCEKLGYKDVYSCFQGKEFDEIDCQNVHKMSEDWSRARPSYIMLACYHYPEYSKPALMHIGCRKRQAFDIIIAENEKGKGKIILVNDFDKLKEFFAPIKNEKEAMNFTEMAASALGLGKPFAISDVDLESEEFKKFITDPVPSHAEKKKDGWHVWLYDGPVCSCHHGERNEVEYRINEDGTGLEKLKEKKAWQRKGRICVD